MKLFLAALLAVVVVLAGGIVLLTRDFGEEEPIPSSDPVSSSGQLVRQEPLTPTMSLEGEVLLPGFTARGNEAASGELTERDGGRPFLPWFFPRHRTRQQPRWLRRQGGSLSLWGRWSS